MLAQRASTFRLIGAGVTSVGALAAIFGAGGSNAQTLANLETDRAAYLRTHCDHLYNDPPRHAGCYAEKSIEFSRARTETAKQVVTDEAVLRTCLVYLQQQRAGGKTFDRTITRDTACAYARELGMGGGPG